MFSICRAVATAALSALKGDKSSLIPDAPGQVFISHYKASTSEQSSPLPALEKLRERISRDCARAHARAHAHACLGVVAHTFNPSTGGVAGAKAGGSLSSRLAWFTNGAPG